MGKLVKVLGYYVLASTLNVNCDFTPTLLVSAFFAPTFEKPKFNLPLLHE
jgi:hypothetical protein